jgi:hypothetical protein
MSTAALFNSLSHPILTGDWFGRRFDASFESLVRGMRKIAFARACAVGFAGHLRIVQGVRAGQPPSQYLERGGAGTLRRQGAGGRLTWNRRNRP